MKGIWEDIVTERARQESFVASGKFQRTCADPAMTDAARLAVMVEEVGEVAQEIVHFVAVDVIEEAKKSWDNSPTDAQGDTNV